MRKTRLQQAALAPAPRQGKEPAKTCSMVPQSDALKRRRLSNSSSTDKAVSVTQADGMLSGLGQLSTKSTRLSAAGSTQAAAPVRLSQSPRYAGRQTQCAGGRRRG